MTARVPAYGSARRDMVVVVVDYAFGCAGACPACVLTQEERDFARPVTTPGLVRGAFAALAARYGRIGTLAVGVGRANVLALDRSHHPDIVAIARSAAESFDYDDGALEISTSLIGKLDVQIDRAAMLVDAVSPTGFDPRFVVVGNTALASPKYWANVDRFFRTMADRRGGRDVDGTSDILQLTLATDSLPPVADLVALVDDYRFPINVFWAPVYDPGVGDQKALARLGDWLAEFYAEAGALGLDSGLNLRTDAIVDTPLSGVPDYVDFQRQAAGAVMFVSADGNWHEGLFTILADTDPFKFDPGAERRDGHGVMTGNQARDFSRLFRNPACAACPHVARCVAGGTYRLAVIALRRHPGGTSVCPCGMRGVFDRAVAKSLDRATA